MKDKTREQSPKGETATNNKMHIYELISGAGIGARALLEDSPVCTKVIDLDAKLRFMSRAGITRLRIPDIDALYGQTYPAELYPEWIRRPMVEHLNRALNGEVTNVECPLLDADGEEVWYSTTFLPVRDDSGEIQYILATSVEITKRIRAEESLRRTQKLESLGVVAGGIAHDFNNLLTGLTANLSLAIATTGMNPEVSELVSDALEVCESAKGLTTQLLTFAQGGAPLIKTQRLRPIVESAANFSSRGLNVKCVYEFPQDLVPVNVDRDHISQVIHNMVINAAQAMPEGGEITIAASNAELASGEVQGLGSGSYAKIGITDTGKGMTPEELAKAFDPYFTTKEDGHGLGLAASHSIVVKHGGSIEVESIPRKGTTFTIYLPAGLIEDLEDTGSLRAMQTGSGNLLYMDDNAIISAAFERMADKLGYVCALARDGEAALKACARAEKEGTPFDVVIMDLTIPGGMGGRDTVGKLKEKFPGTKAIASSGYSNDALMVRPHEFGFDGVLPKPFSLRDVSDILHRTLDSNS